MRTIIFTHRGRGTTAQVRCWLSNRACIVFTGNSPTHTCTCFLQLPRLRRSPLPICGLVFQPRRWPRVRMRPPRRRSNGLHIVAHQHTVQWTWRNLHNSLDHFGSQRVWTWLLIFIFFLFFFLVHWSMYWEGLVSCTSWQVVHDHISLVVHDQLSLTGDLTLSKHIHASISAQFLSRSRFLVSASGKRSLYVMYMWCLSILIRVFDRMQRLAAIWHDATLPANWKYKKASSHDLSVRFQIAQFLSTSLFGW